MLEKMQERGGTKHHLYSKTKKKLMAISVKSWTVSTRKRVSPWLIVDQVDFQYGAYDIYICTALAILNLFHP
jgi:hypothetical protein